MEQKTSCLVQVAAGLALHLHELPIGYSYKSHFSFSCVLMAIFVCLKQLFISTAGLFLIVLLSRSPTHLSFDRIARWQLGWTIAGQQKLGCHFISDYCLRDFLCW